MPHPRKRGRFLYELAEFLGRDNRTIRRYCERGLIPDASPTPGGHWCGKAISEMEDAEAREYKCRLKANIKNCIRGSPLRKHPAVKIGKLDWYDLPEDLAYFKILDMQPGLSVVEACEERDWDPDPEFNYDPETLEAGLNLPMAQEVWNLQKTKGQRTHNKRPINFQLYAVCTAARTLLRNRKLPTVQAIAAEFNKTPRQLYYAVGASNIRGMIRQARRSEAEHLRRKDATPNTPKPNLIGDKVLYD